MTRSFVALAEQRNLQALRARRLFGLFVVRIHLARDAEAGVVGEHAVETLRRFRCAVGDRDLTGVERVADADTAAVMERDPRGSARRVEERVQDRPVGDGVRAVAHAFGLAEGRSDRARVEVVAADGDGRLEFATTDEFVDGLAHLRALASAQPADTRGEPLKLPALARKPHPALQRLVFGEEFEREVVCASYVFGRARERDPAERAFALAEERTNVFGNEAGDLEGVSASRVEGELAYVVAVVEGDRAPTLKREHRLDVSRHRLHGALDITLRVCASQLLCFF